MISNGPNTDNEMWIDFEGKMNKENIEKVGYMFYLHKLTVDDIIKEDSSAKWEVFSNYLFMICMAESGEKELTEVSIVVGDYFLLTFHRDEINGITDAWEDLKAFINSEEEETDDSFFSDLPRIITKNLNTSRMKGETKNERKKEQGMNKKWKISRKKQQQKERKIIEPSRDEEEESIHFGMNNDYEIDAPRRTATVIVSGQGRTMLMPVETEKRGILEGGHSHPGRRAHLSVDEGEMNEEGKDNKQHLLPEEQTSHEHLSLSTDSFGDSLRLESQLPSSSSTQLSNSLLRCSSSSASIPMNNSETIHDEKGRYSDYLEEGQNEKDLNDIEWRYISMPMQQLKENGALKVASSLLEEESAENEEDEDDDENIELPLVRRRKGGESEDVIGEVYPKDSQTDKAERKELLLDENRPKQEEKNSEAQEKEDEMKRKIYSHASVKELPVNSIGINSVSIHRSCRSLSSSSSASASSSSSLSLPKNINLSDGTPPDERGCAGEKIAFEKKRSPMKVDFLLYLILNSFVLEYKDDVEQIEREVETLFALAQSLHHEGDQEDLLNRIDADRERLHWLHFGLKPYREVLSSLCSATKEEIRFVCAQTKRYLRSVFDLVVFLVEKVESSEETLTNTQANYLGWLSVKLSRTSNRVNRIAKDVTLVMCVFGMMQLIGSTWGCANL
eukprot:MONOS_242.1-p1 / transcript=MONOS_242.1 / gene=MONOS_242 / organism=Monocercomonoides_exilis_PA203 / gene_product=unspecified product / transcript_product=unspecified product / location=Mono_scaffold00004:89421-91727(+) / protein_length=674 / sequence_SO=supercontig / SO=protein_coding / is_pseudo=false